jgi:hypothetical protein
MPELAASTSTDKHPSIASRKLFMSVKTLTLSNTARNCRYFNPVPAFLGFM